MNKREMFIIAIAVSMLMGFLTGLFIWNYFREYDAPVLANVIEPTSTLPNPTVSTTLPEPTTIPTTIPTLAPTPAEKLYARLSHYFPEWGGTNCHPANWNGTYCSSNLTNGKYYEHWSYWAERQSTACPKEYPLGTIFRIDGFGDYECVDRGGSINVLPDQTFFLDLLTPDMPYVHKGDIVTDKYSPAGSYVVEVSIVK